MQLPTLTLNPHAPLPPTRDLPPGGKHPDTLPEAKETKVHPRNSAGDENASLFFVGTATTILYVQILSFYLLEVFYFLFHVKKSIQRDEIKSLKQEFPDGSWVAEIV